MSDRANWCYPSGVVAVLETFLLDQRSLADLAAAPGDALGRALRSPAYAMLTMPDTDDPVAAAAALESALVGFTRSFARRCPDRRVADPLLIDYDLCDLAMRLKADHCGVQHHPVPLSTLPESLADAIAAGHAAGAGSGRSLARAADAVAARANATAALLPPHVVDLVIDGTYLALLPDLTRPLSSPLLDDWARERQRFAAVEAVLRARILGIDPADLHAHLMSEFAPDPIVAALADADPDDAPRLLADPPWGEFVDGLDFAAGAAAVHALSARFDSALALVLEPARYVPFGPERVFAYLWQLFSENRRLRAALAAHPPERVGHALQGT